jgi:transposase InsO family protein
MGCGTILRQKISDKIRFEIIHQTLSVKAFERLSIQLGMVHGHHLDSRENGFPYLTAYSDVYSRKIVGWGLSNAMIVVRWFDVMKYAISKDGCLEIFNSDQGSQYTSSMWQSFMEQNGIQKFMDGKGRALDNIWIERFRKSFKKQSPVLESGRKWNRIKIHDSKVYFVL